ncbi:(E)-4-hydroxy-3-methylbut-2-enyl-diphosphate synthase [Methylacidimicrobium tartarophylax]|uniref:4-hydroxy-3-methylbut-2-en-1-yl diphosphate synthase (flavodoxin) n=1 Tax=Methylacidimicrobium tartarophylax TaxID=1041768 RepID=A0A5E6MBE1_9BACT|nr:(E)-4-hydroxy-3-methylbut-2-enyl-diphosphate synthase [Methylacidimicrobium tartarophylax]VVM06290.1 (E)-4-hydroxy-3-methylbut-2-enyl-diphosphate synthase [Methylacidimicrobium tartarophylax]
MTHLPPSYVPDVTRYVKRSSREVPVGPIVIGGGMPVVIQSMLTSDTMDAEACVREALKLADAGCHLVRITAPTVKDAANLRAVREALQRRGSPVPLVADIHFKPEAALEAARWVDKIRINPGNYADRKKFLVRSYTDPEYASAVERLEAAFLPLVKLCMQRGIAMRIGTNHGSLSDRILNRYGDTPLGMVESALEYARICRKAGFHRLVFSMKASNPRIMISAYRRLVATLQELGPDWNYPVHLGVTEAGDGEDGRVKSAIGIGALLADGIGDTIRVSLTEDSIREIPVAYALRSLIAPFAEAPHPKGKIQAPFDPFAFERRASLPWERNPKVGGAEPVRVAVPEEHFAALVESSRNTEIAPELAYRADRVVELDPEDSEALAALRSGPPRLVTVRDRCPYPPLFAFRMLAARIPVHHPILLKDTFFPGEQTDPLRSLLNSALQLGGLLCDGIGDAILLRGEPDPKKALQLSYNILQATGNRSFKADFVACPSCGRTLFNLQETTARIRAATGHLKGVKIAVMGCIVNGPGEMADADFGYVGGAPGKVNLYVGKKAVRFNIPQEQAVDSLIALIGDEGKWAPPPAT